MYSTRRRHDHPRQQPPTSSRLPGPGARPLAQHTLLAGRCVLWGVWGGGGVGWRAHQGQCGTRWEHMGETPPYTPPPHTHTPHTPHTHTTHTSRTPTHTHTLLHAHAHPTTHTPTPPRTHTHLFPAPDPPRMPIISPGRASQLTPLRRNLPPAPQKVRSFTVTVAIVKVKRVGGGGPGGVGWKGVLCVCGVCRCACPQSGRAVLSALKMAACPWLRCASLPAWQHSSWVRVTTGHQHQQPTATTPHNTSGHTCYNWARGVDTCVANTV